MLAKTTSRVCLLLAVFGAACAEETNLDHDVSSVSEALASSYAGAGAIAASTYAPAAAAPTGWLWRIAPYGGDNGVTAYPAAGGATSSITTDIETPRPIPDGTRFAYYETIPHQNRADIQPTSDLTVAITKTGSTLYTMSFAGRLSGIRPSPSYSQYVMSWYRPDDTNGARWDQRVWDVNAGKYWKLSDAGYVFDWAADGNAVLRVSSNGVIQRCPMMNWGTDRWDAVGSLSLPAGYTVQDVKVDHASSRLLLLLSHANAGSDLWVTDTNGTNLSRLTRTGRTNYGHWSPDDSYIAYNIDPGGTQTDYIVNCKLRYAASTARDLGPDEGQTLPGVRCDIVGWTK